MMMMMMIMITVDLHLGGSKPDQTLIPISSPFLCVPYHQEPYHQESENVSDICQLVEGAVRSASTGADADATADVDADFSPTAVCTPTHVSSLSIFNPRATGGGICRSAPTETHADTGASAPLSADVNASLAVCASDSGASTDVTSSLSLANPTASLSSVNASPTLSPFPAPQASTPLIPPVKMDWGTDISGVKASLEIVLPTFVPASFLCNYHQLIGILLLEFKYILMGRIKSGEGFMGIYRGLIYGRCWPH